MKRALIGGFLALIGTIWCLAALLSAAAYVPQVTNWWTPPGRFGTAIMESCMTVPLIIGAVMLVFGLAVMIYEYFKKDRY